MCFACIDGEDVRGMVTGSAGATSLDSGSQASVPQDEQIRLSAGDDTGRDLPGPAGPTT